MPNELRERFQVILDLAQDLSLATPTLRPGRLGKSWEVDVPGTQKFIGKNPEETIGRCFTFLRGMAAQKDREVVEFEPPADAAEGIAYAAATAKHVLDIKGFGGPNDHELLARAVLALASAVLEDREGRG